MKTCGNTFHCTSLRTFQNLRYRICRNLTTFVIAISYAKYCAFLLVKADFKEIDIMSKDASQHTIQREMLLQLFTKQGLVADKNISNEHIRDAQKKKQLTAYHNTELLLKHYKNIAWMIECFPDTIAEELEQPFKNVDEVIERLDLEITMGNRKIENRLESVRKTRLVLDRVNDALTVLKKKPEDGERLYELIYLTYITPESLNHNELLYRLNLSSRHYYRLREQAISILSIRLWSAPNKDIEFWLELISIMGDDDKKGSK